ncbi:MAG TPA: tRNA (cytidine(34)-2'-O)-methyltransferase [Coxiellaceae bacterium]|nr:tRNA (cytidine(34)-2'-O)-methyltransferase [Coxiellaceae bacterium]
MLHIALYQPEIPPNTGNIIRLCANTGTALHLIHPLGFTLDDKQLKRAGLDYQEYAEVKQYPTFETFLQRKDGRIFTCTTKAHQLYTEVSFQPNDVLLFGPESRGLPAEIRDQFPNTQIKIPMKTSSRSINLCNAVSIILYEALRQTDRSLFPRRSI